MHNAFIFQKFAFRNGVQRTESKIAYRTNPGSNISSYKVDPANVYCKTELS